MTRFFYLCLLAGNFIFANNLLGQQKFIDSIEVSIGDQGIPKEERALSLVRLGVSYCHTDNDKAKMYAKMSINESRTLINKNISVYAYSSMAAVYSVLDSIDQSYLYMDSCLYAIRKTKDMATRASGLNSVALLRLSFGDMEGVGELLLEGIKEIEGLDKERPRWEMEKKLYYNMFEYYTRLGDDSRATYYIYKALNASKQTGHPPFLVHSWNNLSTNYQNLYKKEPRKQVYLDSANYAVNQAMSVYENNRGYVEQYDYIEALMNFSNLYVLKEKNDSVIYYTNKLIDYAQKVGDVEYPATAYLLQGQIKKKEGKTNDAIELLLKAIKTLDDKDYYYQLSYDLYTELSDLYQRNKQFEKALECSQIASQNYKSLKDEKYIQEGQVAEAKYKVFQKDKKILESEQKTQKYLLYIFISVGIVCVLLLLSMVIVKELRKSNQQRKLLAKEKEKISLHAQLQEEETKTATTQKELAELEKEQEKAKTEKQALEISRLQSELIVGISQLEQKSETIEKIKQSISENQQFDKKKIKDLLLTDKMADNSFEDFSQLLHRVHPDFYTKLQEKANQKLTALDLKYCTYIFMNLSGKDIANIMHVELKTVHMTKYRLKQKLNLSKQEDLGLFITGI